ncbi:50S ribosomal protein L19 [Candidatus Gottesmanbacteria bacterium RBG_16_52_11]|uniref:Large ribosomal subunit protein bL19 n=1 Tax=Candidatus Gottesmanbacteria bacterium RBG_16_52_11 TaxID=1798374 RepID=A0A1F5YQB4_9BACT|nr:MAG: 50S ribosomal protein L19 [Candidatus Gottesmanbacteria bacterium RBG_16_52_11]
MAIKITWTQPDKQDAKPTVAGIGDTVRVHYKLIEKEKVSGKAKREVHVTTRERIQVFEGILIAVRGSGSDTMMTVRRIGTGAIGIERIFPLTSPWIRKLEVKKRADVRRAKLYYLRARKGRLASKLNEADVRKNATAGVG